MLEIFCEMPKILADLDKKKVKMAGYIVPLTDNFEILDEFLLVPTPQACVHVPAPPPNLIVHVKLKKALPVEKVSNPSWILGPLQIRTTENLYGESAYQMVADRLEAVEEEEFDY